MVSGARDQSGRACPATSRRLVQSEPKVIEGRSPGGGATCPNCSEMKVGSSTIDTMVRADISELAEIPL